MLIVYDNDIVKENRYINYSIGFMLGGLSKCWFILGLRKLDI